MNKLILMILAILPQMLLANESTTSFQLTAVVPTIVTAKVIQQGQDVVVNEKSNSPSGYTLYLSTTADHVIYDGKKILNNNNSIKLTQITHQESSVDLIKKLRFSGQDEFYTLTVEVN